MIYPDLLKRLCHARDLLRDWEEEPLSISAIARASSLTRFHFIRVFKALFGETPHQYRLRAQIEKAKHLLILTDSSITDICMTVGFSSHGSFSALFRRRVGMSPSEFQRRYRAQLRENHEAYRSLLDAAKQGNITLLYSARDAEHNNAIVLKSYLEERLTGKKSRPTTQK